MNEDFREHEAADDLPAGESSSSFEAVLRAVAAAPPVEPGLPPRRLPPGTVIDERFRIESILGQGAMGVVYLARDLTLERDVALKLHRYAGDEERSARMWREAKAMARLAHPNVITIHEVGTHERAVYIAMELVDGGTLEQWLQQPRSWREVMAVFVQVARGLAAAHDAGLVHRDLKPSNVLLGRDGEDTRRDRVGRARVADFGLARSVEAATDEATRTVRSASDSSSTLGAPLTRTGAAVGTPAYMAPEQLAGAPADHRSDQYAFFVSLHEALYGVRPTKNGSGRVSVPPVVETTAREAHSGRVPAWIDAIVSRGLQADTALRFADMHAVIEQLERDPTRKRRLVTAAVGLGLAAVTTWGGLALHEHRVREQCRAGAQVIDETWNAQSQRRLALAFVQTGVPHAVETHARTEPHISDYRQRWRDLHQATCIAVRVDETLDEATGAATHHCLEVLRAELAALLEVLSSEPNAGIVQEAAEAVTSLGEIDRCNDPGWLSRHPPSNTYAREHRSTLRRAQAHHAAGDYAAGLALAKQVLAETEPSDIELYAWALVLAGELAEKSGDSDEAATLLVDGFEAALAAGDDDLALEAATELVYTVGSGRRKHEEGLWWARVAHGLARRLNGIEGLPSADLHNNVGAVLEVHGQPEAALAEHERALAIRLRELDPAHPDVAYSHNNVGTSLLALDRHDEAEQSLLEAASILERALGPHHPQVAMAYNNLGAIYLRKSRPAEAEQARRRALAGFRDGLGPDHPHTAMAHGNLGSVLLELGRHDDAERELERAISIYELVLGEDHPGLGVVYYQLGRLYDAQERHTEAEQAHRRALAIAQAAFGSDHPRTATSHYSLGQVYAAMARHEEAEREYLQALRTFEALGTGPLKIATVRESLAALYLERGRHAEAEALLVAVLVSFEEELDADHPRITHNKELLAATRRGAREPRPIVISHDVAPGATKPSSTSSAGEPPSATPR